MKRPQYFAAKPLQDKDITVYNEIELWRAVLDQALQDISQIGFDKEFRVYNDDAEELLINEKEDFEEVCDYAYLDPDKTRDEFYYIMGVANDRRKKYGGTGEKDESKRRE